MKENGNITCRQAKEIDLVLYLSTLGYEPKKIKGDQFWYLSPFRNEKTPSFKVNRLMNRWYDFGEGIGGSIIDFGIRYYHCSVPEFLNSYLGGRPVPLQNLDKVIQPFPKEPVLLVNSVRNLSTISLIKYLTSRMISFELANVYLKEVNYTNSGRQFYGLGFQNNNGGWEIRSKHFKGSAAPKFLTQLSYGSDAIQVFEGFMNFLSFLQLNASVVKSLSSDFLILNSTTMVAHAIPILHSYNFVDLYLDNDPAGDRATCLIKLELPKVKDNRIRFAGYSDLNEYLCAQGIMGWTPT
ncbi:toprim domain-containing protein [Sphingobacterium multivorum]|uniref:toprim domain-containing protein n=1 Tax=Sphingobacterium multivorum TaxID=28454 RepID=UPI000F8FDBC9|nr:toprim domain-containing protein [Sphingobacterium multivorum]